MSQFVVQGVSSPHFMVLPETRFQSPAIQNFKIGLSGVARFQSDFYIASTLNINKVSIRDYNMKMDSVINRAKPLLPILPEGTEYGYLEYVFFKIWGMYYQRLADTSGRPYYSPISTNCKDV